MLANISIVKHESLPQKRNHCEAVIQMKAVSGGTDGRLLWLVQHGGCFVQTEVRMLTIVFTFVYNQVKRIDLQS